MVLAQDGVVLALLVVDVHERGALAGGLQRLGEHRGDDLPAIGDGGRLQDVQLAVVDLRDARRVLVGEHGEDAGVLQGGLGVDRGDAAVGDRRADDPAVGDVVGRVLDGVARDARDLVGGVKAAQRGAEGERAAHAVRASSWATIKFLANGIL